MALLLAIKLTLLIMMVITKKLLVLLITFMYLNLAVLVVLDALLVDHLVDSLVVR
jgi:hypothetical protein